MVHEKTLMAIKDMQARIYRLQRWGLPLPHIMHCDIIENINIILGAHL